MELKILKNREQKKIIFVSSSRVYAIEDGEVLADAVDFDVEGTLTNYVDIFSSRSNILPVRDY